MTTIKVEIVKSTAKAHLVESDGRKAWIQKRWLREDGTVNAKTFERQAAEQNALEKVKKADQEFKSSLHELGPVERETEKAIAIKAYWHEEHTDQAGSCLAWLPKSQIQGGQAPGWLLNAKARELPSRITNSQGAYFNIRLAGIDFGASS